MYFNGFSSRFAPKTIQKHGETMATPCLDVADVAVKELAEDVGAHVVQPQAEFIASDPTPHCVGLRKRWKFTHFRSKKPRKASKTMPKPWKSHQKTTSKPLRQGCRGTIEDHEEDLHGTPDGPTDAVGLEADEQHVHEDHAAHDALLDQHAILREVAHAAPQVPPRGRAVAISSYFTWMA